MCINIYNKTEITCGFWNSLNVEMYTWIRSYCFLRGVGQSHETTEASQLSREERNKKGQNSGRENTGCCNIWPWCYSLHNQIVPRKGTFLRTSVSIRQTSFLLKEDSLALRKVTKAKQWVRHQAPSVTSYKAFPLHIYILPLCIRVWGGQELSLQKWPLSHWLGSPRKASPLPL